MRCRLGLHRGIDRTRDAARRRVIFKFMVSPSPLGSRQHSQFTLVLLRGSTSRPKTTIYSAQMLVSALCFGKGFP